MLVGCAVIRWRSNGPLFEWWRITVGEESAKSDGTWEFSYDDDSSPSSPSSHLLGSAAIFTFSFAKLSPLAGVGT
jgi:hypothetical protein